MPVTILPTGDQPEGTRRWTYRVQYRRHHANAAPAPSHVSQHTTLPLRWAEARDRMRNVARAYLAADALASEHTPCFVTLLGYSRPDVAGSFVKVAR